MEILLSQGPFYTIGAVRKENGIDKVQIFESQQVADALGRIVLGRVESYAENLKAYFIQIGHEKPALLHMKDLKNGESLHVGDLRMVQVFRESSPLKGARVTGLIQIKGLHCVYMPYEKGVSLSRKLSPQVQERLKKEYEYFLEKSQLAGGVVVRSSAGSIPCETLMTDLNQCLVFWKQCLEKIQFAQPMHTFWMGGWMEWVKENLSIEGETVIKSNRQGLLNTLEPYLKLVRKMDMNVKVKYESAPFFMAYSGMNDWIESLLSKKQVLPSGGNIIVEETEALTVFDVNTSGSGSVSADVTNREAVRRAFEWLDSSKTGGISIVDLVGCESESSRERYFKLSKQIAKDYPGMVVHGVSKLGLLELTSPNEGQSLVKRIGREESPTLDWVMNQMIASMSEVVDENESYTLTVGLSLWEKIVENQQMLKNRLEGKCRLDQKEKTSCLLYIVLDNKKKGYQMRLGNPHKGLSSQGEEWIKFSIPMDYCVDA